MDAMKNNTRAMLAAGGAYSIFGLSYLFSKMALGAAEPSLLLAVRFAVTFLALNLMLLCRAGRLRLKGKPVGMAVLMGVGNGVIMNWYYQTHIGLDMRYFWKHILSIVPAMLPAVALGIIAVRLHTFTGYAGVVTFAVPYAAVYAVGLYLFAMDESEKDMVRGVMRKIRR